MANMLMTMLQSSVLAQSHGVVKSRYGGGWDELRKATGEHSGTGTKLAWDSTTVGYIGVQLGWLYGWVLATNRYTLES